MPADALGTGGLKVTNATVPLLTGSNLLENASALIIMGCSPPHVHQAEFTKHLALQASILAHDHSY